MRPETTLRLFLTSALLAILTNPLAGQLEPPSTGGIVALDQELRTLGHYKRVLMIGAHPDDEDTELLTVLVRGMGAEAAYLSLNRGEGGQNLIGAELDEALGLIRTEELLAARRLDGARQFFTRAYDFGFSKTLEETWSHWPRDTILKDVVRIVRRFRPQVIVSVFSGTPRDGHGQHQAAGWAAREAFRVAADSTRFAELEWEEGLAAWAPSKLYRSTRFDTAATNLTLDGGVLDPAVGKTLHQIAMTGRSLHRSQDMGRLQEIGPSTVRLELLADRTGPGRRGLFDGIDTTFGAMPWAGPRGELLARVDSARRALGNAGSALAAALLSRAERDLLGSRPDSAAGHSWPTPEQADQLRHLSRAAAVAAGLVGDAVADDDRVVPGQRLSAAVTAWNGGRQVERIATALSLPAGWRVAADSLEAAELPPGAVARGAATLEVGRRVAPSTPYVLRRPLQGALYDWSATAPGERGEPFDTAAPFVRFLRGQPGSGFAREVTFRINDQARGEVRRPLAVVPRVDVRLDPATE
ncbi:MAG: PIG-L family deacetylase, partial [Gemmatimonadales bacterium]